MPSELDPLLPQNDPSPEIQSSWRPRTKRHQNDIKAHIVQDTENNQDSGGDNDSPRANASSLRPIMGIFVFVVGLGLLTSFVFSHGFRRKVPSTPSVPDASVAARVHTILSENPLFDGHDDLAFFIRFLYNNHIYDTNFTEKFEKGGLPGQVDLPRLSAGKISALSSRLAKLSLRKYGCTFRVLTTVAVSSTLSQIDLLRRMTAAYPETFSSPDLNRSSATQAFENQHLLISPIGIEGLHQIGNTISNLRIYYSLGVRYATLTHNCHNPYADAALVTNATGQTVAADPYWGGVSEIGRTVVGEMNRLGMLVDLAHVSKATMIDVLGGRPKEWAGSKAPVIFSHSSAFALCPHPRNVPDNVLELVKKTKSLVMVNFSPDFISCVPSDAASGLPELYPPNATLHQVARHIKYIGDQIGYDHVGIGSDFDGILETPEGLEDVSKFPDLVQALLEMGITDGDAAKLVGRNLLRVWADVDMVSTRLKTEGALPAEDALKNLQIYDFHHDEQQGVQKVGGQNMHPSGANNERSLGPVFENQDLWLKQNSDASQQAKELSLVGKVELRIALTHSDTKLESVLNTYLPPLLLKLASDHVSVRNKVISICQHVNTRIKAPQIKLPVAALLKQYKENVNPLIRHFDLLYIQQGLDRLQVSVRLDLLPLLVNGIHQNFLESARHTSSLFNMLLKLLHSLTLPPRGSADDLGLRHQLGFVTAVEDAQFVASWIGRLILYTADRSRKSLPGLNVEDCNFLQLYDNKDTWQPSAAGGMILAETKVVAIKFLASGAFTDTERFFPALFASSDPNSRISDIGDDMLKRAVPAISLDRDEILEHLFQLYLGTKGSDGSLPARAPLQTRILGLLCKSKRATSYTAESIQILRDGLTSDSQGGSTSFTMGKQGLEASKLRAQIFTYANWLARMSETADIDMVAPSLVSQLRGYIESQGWPIYNEASSGQSSQEVHLRSLGYESIGVLARASPTAIVLDVDLDLLRWLFDSLAADSAGREVNLSIESALSSVLGAFGGSLSKELETSLEGLLLHNMQRQPGDTEGSGNKIVRSTQFTAVRFANRCLPFSNTKARWINALAIGDGTNTRREVLEDGRKGLNPYWYRMLNPEKLEDTHEKDVASSKYDFPRLVDLIEQFFGSNSPWNSSNLQGKPLPMSDAYSVATRFCHNVLLYQGLSSALPALDSEWERQLEILVSNDGKAREKIKNYVRTLAANAATRSALELLLVAEFTGIVTPTSKEISSSDCSQTEVQGMISAYQSKSKAWQEAVGSQYIDVHGAVLAITFTLSRRSFRIHSSATPMDKLKNKPFIDVILEILTSSHDKTLLDAVIVSIYELSLFRTLSPDSLLPAYSAVAIVKKLAEHAEKGNENAVKALGAFAMQCEEDLAERSAFDQIIDTLFKLYNLRDPAIQFAVGEALSYAAAGWRSKALIAALDIEGSPPPSASRDIALSSVLDRILEE
ncbi:MAG: hypothetical protein Q9177_003985, partial [Variospora cf. flavescens]